MSHSKGMEIISEKQVAEKIFEKTAKSAKIYFPLQFLVVGVAILIFAPYVPTLWLTFWSGGQLINMLYRYTLLKRHILSSDSDRHRENGKWQRPYFYSVLITGILWGALILFLPFLPESHYFFIYSLILTITFASTSTIGPILRFYLAYVGPMNFTILVDLLWHGTLLHTIAAISLLFSFHFALRSSRMHLKEYTKILKDEAYARRLKQHYEKLAGTDTLTGLPNRYRFFELFEELIRETEEQKSKLALLFLDLDDFKIINDTYGHAAGDMILRETGNRLVSFLGERGIAARLAGDEFVLLVRNPETKEKILSLARKIATALQMPIAIDSMILTVRPSIGIVCYPFHGGNPSELLRAADAAMYQSKATGEPQWFQADGDISHLSPGEQRESPK